MSEYVHGFVDGAYLRKVAEKAGADWPNPYALVSNVSHETAMHGFRERLLRVTYYDARPKKDSEVLELMNDYWRAIEELPDTELGFGSLRGGTDRRAPRQKGVDTLMAVDMLVGAFDRIFTAVILIAGDADFVPVLQELKRRGVRTIVAAEKGSDSEDLRRVADRYLLIGPAEKPVQAGSLFPHLKVDGRSFRSPGHKESRLHAG